MANITKHVQIPTGHDSEGKPEFLTAGFVTEEHFGNGNTRRRVWLHTSVLNPVLFQQVRPFVGKSSHVMLGHVDLRRKYKGPEVPADDGGEAESGGPPAMPANVAEAVEKLQALLPGIPDAVPNVGQANAFGRAVAEVIGLLGGQVPGEAAAS